MANRCPRCQRDTVDYPTDTLGRVSLACWACGWREPHSVRRPQPDPEPTPEQKRERKLAQSAEARRLRVLVALHEHGPLTVGQLTHYAGMQHGLLRIVLGQLLADGQIERRLDGHKNAHRYGVAPAQECAA